MKNRSLIKSQTSNLLSRIFPTGVISAAVPVIKQPLKLEISLGDIFLSFIQIEF